MPGDISRQGLIGEISRVDGDMLDIVLKAFLASQSLESGVNPTWPRANRHSDCTPRHGLTRTTTTVPQCQLLTSEENKTFNILYELYYRLNQHHKPLPEKFSHTFLFLFRPLPDRLRVHPFYSRRDSQTIPQSKIHITSIAQSYSCRPQRHVPHRLGCSLISKTHITARIGIRIRKTISWGKRGADDI